MGCDRDMRTLQMSSEKFLPLGLVSEGVSSVGELTTRLRREMLESFEFTFIKIKSPSRDFQIYIHIHGTGG